MTVIDGRCFRFVGMRTAVRVPVGQLETEGASRDVFLAVADVPRRQGAVTVSYL